MLALSINPTKPTYDSNEPVRLTVALSNDTAQPVTVNKRLALNSPFAPAKFREIKLSLQDSTGSEQVFGAKINIGFPLEKDFAVLEPQGKVERQFDLRQYFELNQPGRYELKATYQNQSDPDGSEAWKGVVESESVSIEIG